MPVESKAGGGPNSVFSDNSKQKDVRTQNIIAATAVSDCVRTSLGPKGMDKMITGSNGEVLISNDGATILKKMEIMHPAAQMLVDLSQAQDVEAGDGTTSVVVLAGGFLKAAKRLLDKSIHPSVIARAFQIAAAEGEKILRDIAIPANLSDRDALVKSAQTSLNSKVVSDYSDTLAPLAVDAVLRITQDQKLSVNVDLNDIKVVKKVGGTVEDTELVDGIVFDQGASHSAGGPTRITGAKIGLIQYQLSPPKTNMENQVVVDDYNQIDRILKEERRYIQKLVKPIIKSGCNCLLIQKSILRDAVNDLSLHYLAKKGIMVITNIERSDIEFISSTLGCIPVADPEGFTASKLGQADLVEEVNTAGGSIVKVTGVGNVKTVSVLVRGSNRLVIDEAERSVHDALCVVRCLVKERFVIAGGGVPETEMGIRLSKFAETLNSIDGYCIKEYARALDVVPYTLAENAGLHPMQIVTELRRQHVEGNINAGINVKKGQVADITEQNVLQPLLVNLSSLKLATECVRMMLKIDDVVAVR